MFWRILLKLLFKACLPLLILMGVLNYTLYLKGGDPLALWSSIGDTLKSGFQSKLNSVVQTGSELTLELPEVPALDTGGAKKDRVFVWQDDQGQTHFSSTDPDNARSTVEHIDPRANVIEAFVPPTKPEPTQAQQRPEREALRPDGAAQSERMPGMAGILDDPRMDTEALKSLDPKQLAKILKASQQISGQLTD